MLCSNNSTWINHNLCDLKLWHDIFFAYSYVCKFWFILQTSAARTARCKPVFFFFYNMYSQSSCLCFLLLLFQVKSPFVWASDGKESAVNSVCKEVTRGSCVREYWELLCWHGLGWCQPPVLTLHFDLSSGEVGLFFWLQLDSSAPSAVKRRLKNISIDRILTWTIRCVTKYLMSTHTL